MKLFLVAFGILAYAGSINAQTSDSRLRRIESRLDEANSELAEINQRERAKELATQKAEEERLLSLPLDPDLKASVREYYLSLAGTIKNISLMVALSHENRISVARIQDKRNALK